MPSGWAPRSRHAGWMAVGTVLRADWSSCWSALAMLALMHAYVTSDFTVINVVENSHTDKPLLYKITGVWGNHEGSMLLWVFMLSLCAAAVALFSDNLPPPLQGPRAGCAGPDRGWDFCCSSCSPRTRSCAPFRPPPNGRGLNPVLQDPGLGVPSAVSLPRLCRVLGRLRLCRRRADRGPRRRRLGALGKALDVGVVVRADDRYRDGVLVGVLHAWAGAAGGSGTRSRTPLSCPGWSGRR